MVSEWTATATDADGRAIEWDGIDVFPFRDGLIAPQGRLLRFPRSAPALALVMQEPAKRRRVQRYAR